MFFFYHSYTLHGFICKSRGALIGSSFIVTYRKRIKAIDLKVDKKKKKMGFLMFFVFAVYKKAEVALNSKHSNGGSLDRYTADPNQRGVQARADIIRPRPTPCKIQIPHPPRKTNSPVVLPACVYLLVFFFVYHFFIALN